MEIKMMNDNCECGKSLTIVFACSGASNVGQLSNAAAIEMSGEGYTKMGCLTGIGGGISTMILNAKSASRVLIIDGCQICCGKRTIEKAGIDGFHHLIVTDLGVKKNYDLRPNDEELDLVMTRLSKMLSE